VYHGRSDFHRAPGTTNLRRQGERRFTPELFHNRGKPVNQAIFNPWAPPLLNGLNNTSPDNCTDVDGAYVWPESQGFQILTANEQRSETIVLDNDDDFRFAAFQWSLGESEGGNPGFLYRIQDDLGHFISDGFVFCFATPGTMANPWPIFPHVTYPLHHRINFEIINLSADDQGVQLVFRGPKRFRRVG
jgi:hypothetical protein